MVQVDNNGNASNIRSSFADKLFFVAAFLLAINLLSYQVLDFEEYKNILRYAAAIILMIAILIKFRKIRFHPIETCLFIYSCLMATFARSELTGNAVNLIVIILIVWASQDVNRNLQQKYFGIIGFVSLLLWFTLLATKVISIEPWEATRFGGITRIRYMLGFKYEINLAAWYLTTSIIAIYIWKRNSKLLQVVSILTTILIYFYTDSRTTFLFSIIFFTFTFVISTKRGLNIKFRTIKIIYIVIFIVPIMASLLMNIFPWIDSWLSGRLSSITSSIEGMTIKNYIFGWYYKPVSNFYYLIITQFGILVYYFIYRMFARGTYNLIHKNQYYETAVIIGCVFVGLAEGSLFAPEEISTIMFWAMLSRGLHDNGK